MAAPDNAVAIGTDGPPRDEETGKVCTRENMPTVTCQGCRWQGSVLDLLGVDDEETMRCPQCRTAAWIYD